jgi:hypothetical protein
MSFLSVSYPRDNELNDTFGAKADTENISRSVFMHFQT